jgi:chromate reductase
MTGKLNILAISGSTRQKSSNLNLIKAIAELTADVFDITIFDGLTELPHFNADLDGDLLPDPVKEWRKLLRAADGVLICTPEYAIGVPGTLKNAIDWTVSSMEFSKKPVALITASLAGERAHESLLGTLLMIEAKMSIDTQLLISFIKTKVSDHGLIINEGTLEQVLRVTNGLARIIRNEPVELITEPPFKIAE